MRVTQGMLLAAGLSTRLRPLTNRIPKALLPFWDRTVLDFAVAFFESGGIDSAAVNVHHGRDPFLKALAKPHPIRLTPFVEEPILGTGGGIKNMRGFVTDDTFVVANCDVIADIDLRAAVKFHLEKNAIATMVLIGKPDSSAYRKIGIDDGGRIVQFPYGGIEGKPKRVGVFSGIHVFDRSILNEFPDETVFDINQVVYAALLRKGAPVFGYFSPSSWFDLGETALYAQAQFELLRNRPAWLAPFLGDFVEKPKGVFIHKFASVDAAVKFLAPTLISQEVRLASGGVFGPEVIVGPRTQLGPNSRLMSSIIYPDLSLPPGTSAESQVVSPGARVSFRPLPS